jgi:hypothetical protein
MQIHRNTPPLLTPWAATPDIAQAPAAEAQKAVPVVPDLNSLSMEQQLSLGRSMGVFTKITYSKEGLMTANPFSKASASADPHAAIASPEFVSNAVQSMRDFEEGMAVLKSHAPAADTKAADFWSGGVRSLQNVAARLNVFA